MQGERSTTKVRPKGDPRNEKNKLVLHGSLDGGRGGRDRGDRKRKQQLTSNANCSSLIVVIDS